MAGFLDRLLSGKYPALESIWRIEFNRLADEVLGRMDTPSAGLDEEFDESAVEADMNTEIEALRADLRRVSEALCEERARHEAVKRELCVTRANLKSALYKIDRIQSVMDAGAKLHGEPIG